ncbi:MAG: helix-turn-helix transcriptional regulator [Dysgonamonadaceae bacterium]|jgi:DNA-binding CsgD family transcriptional regulator|nr:helix-turn-helix transcriptional regulator [Dysgonamonadaceae bacterium]
MVRIDDFFIASNSVSNIPEEEYQKVNVLIDAFEAVSRITYQSLYIIDYSKKNFLYVSNNPMFLCGHTAQEVKELGYMFYLNHIPEQEQTMLTEINAAGFNFYENVPVDEKIKCTISYDFHLVNGRKKMLVNHKLTPVLLTKNGRIWLAACIVSLSTHTAPGHVAIRKTGQTTLWEYSLKNHCWKENEEIILAERGKDILSLSAQGYTMNEIADRLCIALDTIKFHKRKIFDRLQVKNIAEALSFATNYKLL